MIHATLSTSLADQCWLSSLDHVEALGPNVEHRPGQDIDPSPLDPLYPADVTLQGAVLRCGPSVPLAGLIATLPFGRLGT
jgi:hypothetical protein